MVKTKTALKLMNRFGNQLNDIQAIKASIKSKLKTSWGSSRIAYIVGELVREEVFKSPLCKAENINDIIDHIFLSMISTNGVEVQRSRISAKKNIPEKPEKYPPLFPAVFDDYSDRVRIEIEKTKQLLLL